MSEASQKLASLGQQTLEAEKAKTDAAAAREEAQKQLAQTQAELGTAIKADAVPHLRNTFLAQIRQAVGAKPGVQVADDRLVIANDGLFLAGSATLSPAGRNLLTQIAAALKDAAANRRPIRIGSSESRARRQAASRRALPQQLGSVGGPRHNRRTVARRRRRPCQSGCGGDVRREPAARPGGYARGLRQEPPHRDPLDRAMPIRVGRLGAASIRAGQCAMSGRNFKASAGAESGAATAKPAVKDGGISVGSSIGVALSVMAGPVPAIHAVRLPECSKVAPPSVSGQSNSTVRRIGVDGRASPAKTASGRIPGPAPTDPGLAVGNSAPFAPNGPSPPPFSDFPYVPSPKKRLLCSRSPRSEQNNRRGILFFQNAR